GEDRQMIGEGTAQDPDSGTATQWRWLGQVDQPVDLAPANLLNHRIRDLGRPDTVHNQTERPRRPPRGMPLELDQEETIAGEERRPGLDRATKANAPIS